MTLSRRAQSIMEYMLLLGIITAAVVYMLPHVKRTSQSMMKSAADQIGTQKGADQTFNDVETGYLVNSQTKSRRVVENLRKDRSGSVDQTYDEMSDTTTTSFTNGGWSRE